VVWLLVPEQLQSCPEDAAIIRNPSRAVLAARMAGHYDNNLANPPLTGMAAERFS
jgi:hypothetical protein